MSAVAIAAIGFGWSADAFGYSFNGPMISTSSYTVAQGNPLNVYGSGYAADEMVTITLMSSSVTVGSVMTNGDGGFSTTVVIPSTTALGNHTIVGTGATGDVAHTGIFVTAVFVAAPQTTSSSGGLAFTGADIAAVSGVGVLAVGVGGLLVLAGRRKRAHNA